LAGILVTPDTINFSQIKLVNEVIAHATALQDAHKQVACGFQAE
jgi:hypothetical protein